MPSATCSLAYDRWLWRFCLESKIHFLSLAKRFCRSVGGELP